MSKISIAMATYCGEKYLLEQLNSLLNQTRKPDEVVIFDDCSKDNTASLVKSFISENGLNDTWNFTVNSENKGFVKNFAQAIEATTGDIIFLCDQDDIWYENKISELENLFEQNSDAMAINSSFDFIDALGDIINVPEKPKKTNHDLIYRLIPKNSCEEISRLEVVRSNISPGCTIAFRKKLKDIYLSTSKFIVPHDHEINILSAINGKLYFYNKATIGYRIHENNAIGLSTKGKKNYTDSFEASYNKRYKFLCTVYLHQNALMHINGISAKELKYFNNMSKLYTAKKLIYEKKQFRYVIKAVIRTLFVPRKRRFLKTVIADFLIVTMYKYFGGKNVH